MAHMTMIDQPVSHPQNDMFRRNQTLLQAFYLCDQCHRASIGITVVDDDRLRYSHAVDLLEMENELGHLTWLPLQATSKNFPDVLAHIADAASEAHKCRSVDSLKAAILMARAVVEATAKHHGIIKGTLEAKIDAMFAHGFISELIKDSAHEIRHLGNDMAHGDFAEPQAESDTSEPTPIEVTADDAEEILALMDMMLDEVFQKPAKVQRLREAREAKKVESK